MGNLENPSILQTFAMKANTRMENPLSLKFTAKDNLQFGEGNKVFWILSEHENNSYKKLTLKN